MTSYPYEFHVALDGAGLNGLEGRAGMCVFRYDPDSGKYEYDIKFYEGMAGGHAVSVSPDGTTGFLGSTGQHLMFYDTKTLEQRYKISTLRFEETDSSIKGSTHCVWLSNEEVIIVMGDHLWQANIHNLENATRIGAHEIKVPHAMKLSASGRYMVYGGMDHPGRGEAREVGIFDMESKTVRRIMLPATCWHMVCHPTEDIFYALSFRVLPVDGHDYHEWSMARFKEYAFEIDAKAGRVTRHWTTSEDTHAHINSDVCISDKELIFCNGASGTIVMIDREDFSTFRILDERPGIFARMGAFRQIYRNIIDSFTRGSIIGNIHHHLRAIRISRGTLLDSVYACQLSADQSLLFTANRGLNRITVYNYPDNTIKLRVPMPPLRNFDKSLSWWSDPRLGFHHSTLLTKKVIPGEHRRKRAITASNLADRRRFITNTGFQLDDE